MYQAQAFMGKQDLRLIEKTKPTLGAYDVLIRVQVAGICGSDLEYYTHGYCGGFIPQNPFVLGHEFSGTIEQIGNAVSTVSIGDRVAVDPSMPCHECNYCISGRYNLCKNMRFFGSASCIPHIDGGFAEYVLVPEKNCYTVPDHVSYSEIALIEPFSVALAAVKKITDISSCHVLLFGGGSIGQLIIKALRYYGARSITLVDPRESVQNIAIENGADVVYTPQSLSVSQDIHVCIDASGVPAAIKQAYETVAKGGQMIQVGTTKDEMLFPVNVIMSKELVVKGSFRFAHVFDLGLELLQRKRIALGNIVSHEIPLKKLSQGFELLLCQREHTYKVHVVI